MTQCLKKCTKPRITPSLTVDEVSKKYPNLRWKKIKYIYDFNGGGTSVEDLENKHRGCRMRVHYNTILFSCYNCIDEHCYFRLQKDRLINEGFVYRE